MEKFCWKLLFWQIFFKNFGCVFSRSNTILAISQEWLVQLIWNEKEVHWLDTGYNMWTWPLTSIMTLTLDISRSNFEIALSQELLVWLMWNENELIWYCADCMTLPFDYTHDLDLGVEISRSESKIALSQDWDGWLTWNEKDVSHPFMTIILTSLTMVGWADVPDSDWGDFRRRCAVHISSCYCGKIDFNAMELVCFLITPLDLPDIGQCLGSDLMLNVICCLRLTSLDQIELQICLY